MRQAELQVRAGGLHYPYYYRFTRDKYGRLHKQYVRRSEVEAWRELYERRREWQGERSAGALPARGRERRGNWGLAELALSMPWWTQDEPPRVVPT